MGLSQRHTALVYTWSGIERSWTPGWVWALLQWLGSLLPAITNFLTGINTEPQRQKQLSPAPNYEPQTATPMAGKQSRMPGRANFPPSICSNVALLGSKRIHATLKEYAQQHPELTPKEFQLLKQKFDHP